MAKANVQLVKEASNIQVSISNCLLFLFKLSLLHQEMSAVLWPFYIHAFEKAMSYSHVPNRNANTIE